MLTDKNHTLVIQCHFTVIPLRDLLTRTSVPQPQRLVIMLSWHHRQGPLAVVERSVGFRPVGMFYSRRKVRQASEGLY